MNGEFQGIVVEAIGIDLLFFIDEGVQGVFAFAFKGPDLIRCIVGGGVIFIDIIDLNRQGDRRLSVLILDVQVAHDTADLFVWCRQGITDLEADIMRREEGILTDNATGDPIGYVEGGVHFFLDRGVDFSEFFLFPLFLVPA